MRGEGAQARGVSSTFSGARRLSRSKLRVETGNYRPPEEGRGRTFYPGSAWLKPTSSASPLQSKDGSRRE